ncbi:MAG: hypothetical protein N5P05_004456 (plasmid) [Chroococcopsis gigantea SAG 12.99]|nr:hypothetical protein [Chroococcopsis gigantea SAG 12.99]
MTQIPNNITIDCTLKENVRATVLKQAELLMWRFGKFIKKSTILDKTS